MAMNWAIGEMARADWVSEDGGEHVKVRKGEGSMGGQEEGRYREGETEREVKERGGRRREERARERERKRGWERVEERSPAINGPNGSVANTFDHKAEEQRPNTMGGSVNGSKKIKGRVSTTKLWSNGSVDKVFVYKTKSGGSSLGVVRSDHIQAKDRPNGETGNAFGQGTEESQLVSRSGNRTGQTTCMVQMSYRSSY
ncbi:hypothetical protein RB195_004929 [Necator americanus]|uniref:Uncharacterized protein n=1 Tax=Necator americanus TaxID=51031 RepID=A0ABR1BNQ6_NECAM